MTLGELRAAPGRYTLWATLGPWPTAAGLAGQQSQLALALPGGKSSSTWQLDLVFWGALVSVFVVWPLLGLLLLWRLWRALFPRRRAA